MNLQTESTKEKLLNIVSSFNTTPFLFIGSGITRRYCNLPSWDSLLEYFSNLLNPSNEFAYPNYKRQANNDYSLLGSIIGDEFDNQWFSNQALFEMSTTSKDFIKQGTSPFKCAIAEYLQSIMLHNPEYENEELLLKEVLANNISGIITTNYDTFIEDMMPDFKTYVSQKDLFEAVEVVLVGKEKKDRIMSQEERRIVSYHEVGHALVSALQKDAEPVQKITIVPRTMGALGYVMQTPEEEKFLNTKKELQAMLVGLLAGRAAEEVVFDTVTTGASNDIEKATSVARAMITQYGMSEKFGLIGLESIQNRYLDGRPVSNCGQQTASEIDEEVMKMLKDAYEEAKQLLRDHRQSLDRIAAFLIEKETITGKEFMEIFHEVEGIDPDAPKKEEARIGMNPVEGEGFVMKSADDTAEEPVEAIKEVVCEEE